VRTRVTGLVDRGGDIVAPYHLWGFVVLCRRYAVEAPNAERICLAEETLWPYWRGERIPDRYISRVGELDGRELLASEDSKCRYEEDHDDCKMVMRM